MHGDGGNTGSTDFAGPKGRPFAKALNQSLGIMLWGSGGTLTSAFLDPETGKLAIGAFDPETLQLVGSWTPSTNQSLTVAYMNVVPKSGGDQIIVGTSQGRILIIRRTDCTDGASFHLTRQIDVSNELGPGESLFNNMIDTYGNIWFTSGAFLGPANTTTVGYATPNDTIHKTSIDNQVVENGMSLSGDTVFVLTGPPATSNHREDGILSAYTLRNSTTGGPRLLWQSSYNAGSGVKLGGFARGSGTTPSLLGHDFIATTDNDDGQLHLIITHQGKARQSRPQTACKVPIFAPGFGAADIRPTAYFDGQSYKVAILNTYNSTSFGSRGSPDFEVNGNWNNKGGMPGGIATVEVSKDGNRCEVVWTSNLTVTMVPILSTASGLFYSYVQDPNLASEGKYVWYVVAVDWQSGKEVWKVKAGAGGIFNDNLIASSIGPNGAFYQPVLDGIVMVKDT